MPLTIREKVLEEIGVTKPKGTRMIVDYDCHSKKTRAIIQKRRRSGREKSEKVKLTSLFKPEKSIEIEGGYRHGCNSSSIT